ncbi:MAG: CDP-alcohol phosphatidyltransferase family protein [Pseudomonadales bacterium]|jgi:phosphatidylglycerophosphate synthase|nr:CDP-alcohol phosphatidyltransferase family protein [Pseudomonadales bacterium]
MLAHCLTALRLLLAVPTALAFAAPQYFPAWAPLSFMLVAIASDIADGKVARAQGTASAAGQLFDHGTDCLFVTSALSGTAYAGLLTPWLPPLVLLAFTQYVVDSRFLHRQKHLRMSAIGRRNGIFYFAPPLILASAALLSAPLAEPLRTLAYWLAWALVLSTLVSIFDRALAPRI